MKLPRPCTECQKYLNPHLSDGCKCRALDRDTLVFAHKDEQILPAHLSDPNYDPHEDRLAIAMSYVNNVNFRGFPFIPGSKGDICPCGIARVDCTYHR